MPNDLGRGVRFIGPLIDRATLAAKTAQGKFKKCQPTRDWPEIGHDRRARDAARPAARGVTWGRQSDFRCPASVHPC